MKRIVWPLIFALFFFLITLVVGSNIKATNIDAVSTGEIAVSSSFKQLRTFFANVLWLQLDQYHHIWMYQGNDWTTATDYLPQLWMIIKLDPNYTQAYWTGGYQLAINLGMPSEGIELFREGLIHNPDDPKLLWEYAVVLWLTNHLSHVDTNDAIWDYLNLLRRKNGNIIDSWNEANACLMLRVEFDKDSLRLNHQRISDHYEHRSNFLRNAADDNTWR